VALLRPSLTAMTMFGYAPTSAAAGVPESAPVQPLKLAHEGLLAILNQTVRPRGSEVWGVKE
jgi:hypothetical protein